MQVESFRVFRDLVEGHSFSRSATLNGITQSAVSQQLRCLEQRLRVPLLERASKKFVLTREGQLLYETSREIITHFERFQHQLEEMRNIISGTIRLVAVPSLGLHELPPYIKDFLRTYPRVKIQVDYRRSLHSPKQKLSLSPPKCPPAKDSIESSPPAVSNLNP